MKKHLTELLRKETEGLLSIYLTKIKEWSENHYNVLTERRTWNEVHWCKYFNIEPEIKNKGLKSEFLGFPKGFYNTENSRRKRTMQNEIYVVTRMSLNEHLEREEKKGRVHYENSLNKLVDRIMKKNLDWTNIKIENGSVGVNINITITDGEQTVRAWTIIAEGEIQRPHYRYLIK